MNEKKSKYEMVRVIAARALQIAQGAPILVKIPKNVTDPAEIAKLEYEQDMLPISARKR